MNTDTITALLRKIRALAHDSAAAPGERAAALSKLRALCARHGITEDQLTDEIDFVFVPAPKNEMEQTLAAQLFAAVTDSRECRYWPTGKRGMKVRCTQAQAADLRDAWAHYVPLFRRHQRTGSAEATALRRELKILRASLAALQKNVLRTFLARMELFTQTANPTESTPMTAEELNAYLRLMRAVPGERWQRPAGSLETKPLAISA